MRTHVVTAAVQVLGVASLIFAGVGDRGGRSASAAPPSNSGSGKIDPAICKPFKLTITRQSATDACTMGYLSVDGQQVAYTLEKGFVGNITNISSIQEGTYKAKVRTYPGESRRWRIELSGVPGKDNVQIHIGNALADTKGCILVGSGVGKEECTITDSADAMGKVKKAFYEPPADSAGCPERDIVVEVKGKAKGEKQVKCNAQHSCVQVISEKRGKSCGKPESMDVKVKNVCDHTVKIQMCTDRKSGIWNCGMTDLKPGKTEDWWACEATVFKSSAFHPDDPYSCFEAEQKKWSAK